MQPSIQTSVAAPSRALILAVQPQLRTDAEHEASCQELEALARTLGFDVVEVRSQKRTRLSLDTYVGGGVLERLAQELGGPGVDATFSQTWAREHDCPVDIVLVNDALSPKLGRTLERALDVEILDRAAVILEIFERRARTRQARLEVEIARLHYELPRLRDDTTKRGREGGGGRGERGDKLVALGKRRLRMRITALEAELDALQGASQMRKRGRQEIYQVALVGYTNAGKSSLMRGLTGNDVLVEDQLFATLDTTVRQMSPKTSPAIVVTDTVGFIQDLPHELVASFRSTLEEAQDADLLLLVLDASDPTWSAHLDVTSTTLTELGVDPSRIQIVFNKCDRLSEPERLGLQTGHPRAILTSAHDPRALASLHRSVLEIQERGLCEEFLGLPHGSGALRAEVFAHARVLEERHNLWGTVLRVRASSEHLERWHRQLTAESCEDAIECAWNHGFELDSADSPSSQLCAQDDQGVSWIVDVLGTLEQRSAHRRAERAGRWLSEVLPVHLPQATLLTAGLRIHRPLPGAAYQEASRAFLDSLARVLTTMWRLDVRDAVQTRLPNDSIEEVRASRRDALELVMSTLDVSATWHTRWRLWLEEPAGWPSRTVVLHGALSPQRLRVNQEGAIISMEGWDKARVGDPGQEFLDISTWTGALPALLERLQAHGAPLWDEAEAYIEMLGSFARVLEASALLESGVDGARGRAQALFRGTFGAG